eukprot:scaffold91124_cov22-Tisochrysis_lutea.AAC.1
MQQKCAQCQLPFHNTKHAIWNMQHAKTTSAACSSFHVPQRVPAPAIAQHATQPTSAADSCSHSSFH